MEKDFCERGACILQEYRWICFSCSYIFCSSYTYRLWKYFHSEVFARLGCVYFRGSELQKNPKPLKINKECVKLLFFDLLWSPFFSPILKKKLCTRFCSLKQNSCSILIFPRVRNRSVSWSSVPLRRLSIAPDTDHQCSVGLIVQYLYDCIWKLASVF